MREPDRKDAEETLRFAVLSAIAQTAGRLHRMTPDEADALARTIARELLTPSFRWALRVIADDGPAG